MFLKFYVLAPSCIGGSELKGEESRSNKNNMIGSVDFFVIHQTGHKFWARLD